MDERTRLFVCVLASIGFFATLAGLFGALVGAITWRDGRATGTLMGLSVAQAFSRASERELSRTTWGVLVGGTDGMVFGAVVGTLVGLIAGWYGRGEWDTLRPIALTSVLLVASAVVFGMAALGLNVAGTRAILGLFAGGIAGAVDGFRVASVNGLLAGMLAGAVAGTAVFVLLFRARK